MFDEKKFFSKCFYLSVIFLNFNFLFCEEWKKEVQNCEAQKCFVLTTEKEAKLLGTLMWAEEAAKSGIEMYYDRYFYEGVSLLDEEETEKHIYGPVLEETGKEWANNMSELSFSDYVKYKMQTDSEFAKTINHQNVRYFNDEEREQTEIHWIDGTLWQIGLDSQEKEIKQVAEGMYAFVLGDNQLFLTPKILTHKGKIQHSSFLRGGPVRSAGKMQIGVNGEIVWLSNDSGHYRPGDLEIAEILNYLNPYLPKILFKQIWIRNKSSEAWDTTIQPIRDYDASEIDTNFDIPVIKWLKKFK